MPHSDVHEGLIERLEKALRPLSEHGHGTDHDHLRELYISLLEHCTGDPLERARHAVLQEILYAYRQAPPTASIDSDHVAIQHAKAAIGALATAICRLQEHNHEATTRALQEAWQEMLAGQEYLELPLP